jgi:glycosyltransferase involved in cell wall biosynthesis
MAHVLVIADPVVCVPPVHYGGAERIIAYLCKYLGDKGHTVDLMAKPGSMVPTGTLYEHNQPHGNKIQRGLAKLNFWYRSLRASKKTDIVINFGRVDYVDSILRYSSVPILFVFQNPAVQSEIDYILTRRKNHVRFIGVSRSQFQAINTHGLLDVVHNVAEVTNIRSSSEMDELPYFAFLGRLTANKGVHLAIEAARKAGARLKIAGTIAESEPDGIDYFETKVKPELHGLIEYIGPVNDEERNTLLSNAKALLFPIQWNEPCALVLPESLSCGCPVIGWNMACVPELIQHGETGFVINSVAEMIQAMGNVDSISRQRCQEVAKQRYSVNALGENYERLINASLEAT